MGEDITTKYNNQLAELRINSKPVINLLTMMAEDYIRHAPLVVQLIEKHLTTVRNEIKLPVLYLIDSIIKNVKKDYVELFTQNIVSTFCGVFAKADDKTRGLLWKLRGTWSEHFPQKKLYAIDVKCNQVDPKWPIMAHPPASGSIHVNPRFLRERGSMATTLPNPEQILAHTSAPATNPLTVDDAVAEVQMRAHLLAKQKELLELQTKKVELELLQTKLQMEEKARLQKKEDASKTIDIAVKQEQMLAGMAELAKNKTEKLQQQLSSLHRSASSNNTKSSPSSKSHDSSSDRELKSIKSAGEASSSSVDGSPSKKSKSSRDKGDRDRRDKNKNDKGKERHDSKDKESRHRHRDKDRHGESKLKSRSREKSKEAINIANKTGGEWKDYNEANKASSKRLYRKLESDDGSEEPPKESALMRSPSPPLTSASPKHKVTIKVENTVDIGLHGYPLHSAKSPSSNSQTGGGETSSPSSGGNSPLKRKFQKEKSVEKDRKERENEKNKEKLILSDPRLRRRNERERNQKMDDDDDKEENQESPTKSTVWKDYRERQKAVLRRSYRKTTGIEIKEEPLNEPTLLGADMGPGDVDLRFDTPMDVDLRTEADGSGPEPPSKKSRGGRSTFDDLFGHQDVDLRAGSSWTQVKSEVENMNVIDGDNTENKPPNFDDKTAPVLRSPGPPSPANSVSSNRSTCDPLGRPLVYNRLPNDPEERKRSLDSRSSSIEPVEQFRLQHIDTALQNGNGILAGSDVDTFFAKAKEELKQGFLNNEQYVLVVKQILQAKEASAMREVQQMQQIKPGSWQPSNTNSNTPNPWMTETEDANIWAGFGPGPRRPTDFSGAVRFPGPPNTWDTAASRNLPWMPPPVPAPQGPNPFEEAISQPVLVEDLIPAAGKKELVLADQDIGSSIPIDKINRQIRFYRDTAIILMGVMSDDPRELSFQMDDRPRTVMINGKPLEVYLGETKKFDVNRIPHTLRIGTPGRELFVDDRPYECFFGGRTIKVFLDKRPYTFQLRPPTPQVSVGQVPRYDLVAGRVNLTVDAVINVPLYLDEKLQKIEIFGEPVVLKFCNSFQTVILNGRPFPSNFGARLPFTITLPGSGKHYLRFSKLSSHAERAVQLFIQANYGPGDWNANDNRNNTHFGGRGRGTAVRGGGRGRGGRPQKDMPMDNRATAPNPWVTDGVPETPEPINANPLDLFSNLFQIPSDSRKNNNNLDRSYESDQQPSAPDSSRLDGPEEENTDPAPNVNVSDLVANLIKFGLLPASSEPSNPEPVQEKDAEEEEKSSEETQKEKSPEREPEVKPKPKEKPVEIKPTIPPLPTVDVSLDDNLRERRIVAVAQLFTGVQCSQCGLRFPPDQTLRYSQHLDWHFRQNRREKANARKALSRKWYYDMSDWIQFEEIEDLEERAASLFENQEGDNDNDAKSPNAVMNPEDYTVLASSHEGAICPQCSEGFESYFDEEREEWRFKNARLDDGCEGDERLYHPICYEDYLKSLVEESIIQESVEEEKVEEEERVEEEVKVEDACENKENLPELEEDDDEVLILKEGKKEVVVMEIDIDDDDVGKTDSVNVNVNEDSVDTETKTDNINVEKDNDILNDGAQNCNDSSLDNARDALVQSPILIDEDSTSFLPGLGVEDDRGVFGFALNSGIPRDIAVEKDDGVKIIYEPMKFDFPRIKIEPPDEEPESADALNPDEFLANLQPFLSSTDRSPGGGEPMNIDLTEEDSSDAVDSGARLVNQIRTSIDGNLQHEETATLPFIIAPKIRINISGMDMTPSNSPKDKDKGEPAEQVLVKDDGNETNINSINTEINKDVSVDPVLTEEMKRLKPRLVGRKLTNCPPRDTGKEESGLCVIC